MVGKQLLVGEETAHDVLRRVCSIDAHDEVLRAPVAKLPLLDHDAMRVRKPCRARDVDRDRISPRINDAAIDQHRPLALVHRKAGVLLAGHQEVADVEAGLEADDIAAEQAEKDRVAHLARQHFPVLRRWPGDMHEVLDDRAVQLLADQFGHEVELIVVNHHERAAGQASRHIDHLARDLFVDLDVSVLPGPVNAAVDDGLMGQVPQVVLDEPQDRV